MQRRQILTGAGAALGASALGAPALGQGTQGATRLLKHIPETDLAILDPIVTTPYVTRNHAYMVWDTLYGLDAPDLTAQQYVARQIQEVAFQDLPYLPLGQYFSATVYRRGLSGVLKGLPLFWNLQRSG